jgi:hypothetical protein
VILSNERGRIGRAAGHQLTEREPLPDSPRRGSNLGLGLAIIFVGAALLMGTLNFFAAGFWGNLLATWPFLLIAIGAFLMLRRGRPAAAGIVFALILFAGLATAAGLSAAGVQRGLPVFSVHFGPAEEGSGRPATETRSVPEFQRVHVAGPDRVIITVGGERSVEVTGDDNLLEFIRTEVSDHELRISRERPLRTREPSSVTITVPSLDAVEVIGSGDVELRGVDGGDLFLKINASGRIVAEGWVDYLEVEVTASGDVFAAGLEAERADVQITASGNVRVNARDTLDVQITASGTVFYVGDPRINQTIVASGDVRRLRP